MIALTALGSASAAARLSARSAARSAAPMRSSSTRIVTTLGATRRTIAAYPVGSAQLTAPTNGPVSAMTTNTARSIFTFRALLERQLTWCLRRGDCHLDTRAKHFIIGIFESRAFQSTRYRGP